MRVTPLRPENAMSGNAYPDGISTFDDGARGAPARGEAGAGRDPRGSRRTSAEGSECTAHDPRPATKLFRTPVTWGRRRVLTERNASVRLADSQRTTLTHTIATRGAPSEAHVPTAQPPPEEGPRLPRAHEHPRRPRGSEAPPGPGPQTSHGLARPRPAIRPWPAEFRLATAVSVRDGSSARSTAPAAPITAP